MAAFCLAMLLLFSAGFVMPSKALPQETLSSHGISYLSPSHKVIISKNLSDALREGFLLAVLTFEVQFLYGTEKNIYIYRYFDIE